jgi:hypothetical protein
MVGRIHGSLLFTSLWLLFFQLFTKHPCTVFLKFSYFRSKNLVNSFDCVFKIVPLSSTPCLHWRPILTHISTWRYFSNLELNLCFPFRYGRRSPNFYSQCSHSKDFCCFQAKLKGSAPLEALHTLSPYVLLWSGGKIW